MKALFFPLMLTLFSCSSTHKNFHLPKIDRSEIEIAEIKNSFYDTISVQLNEQQISEFTAIVDDSPAEIRKAIPNYWVFIKLKNDSVIAYKILDHYIGKRDLYVETNRAAYFQKLYEKSKKTRQLISNN